MLSSVDQVVTVEIGVREHAESATLNKDKNWMKFCCPILSRCIDIKKQAVFGMIGVESI
jgi:hypothetical protein